MMDRSPLDQVSIGRLYGIGVGPGDPELLTVKAVRLIQAAPVVAFFAKAGRPGNARTIVDRWMTGRATEMPLHYPMTTEHRFDSPVYAAALTRFYEDAAAALSAHLDAGRDVALLSEGDPLFYGSFMHLHIRLRDRYPVTVVPGVTGMAGCWARAGEPMTWGDDTLSVLPGTLPLDSLVARLRATDAAVIMKLGRAFPKVRRAVFEAGMLSRAIYVERGTMDDEIAMPLAEKTEGPAPYFSLILIPGQGRRPQRVQREDIQPEGDRLHGLQDHDIQAENIKAPDIQAPDIQAPDIQAPDIQAHGHQAHGHRARGHQAQGHLSQGREPRGREPHGRRS